MNNFLGLGFSLYSHSKYINISNVNMKNFSNVGFHLEYFTRDINISNVNMTNFDSNFLHGATSIYRILLNNLSIKSSGGYANFSIRDVNFTNSVFENISFNMESSDSYDNNFINNTFLGDYYINDSNIAFKFFNNTFYSILFNFIPQNYFFNTMGNTWINLSNNLGYSKECCDLDVDGICDAPLNISGVIDNFPKKLPFDETNYNQPSCN